jgi:hypothetical protein
MGLAAALPGDELRDTDCLQRRGISDRLAHRMGRLSESELPRRGGEERRLDGAPAGSRPPMLRAPQRDHRPGILRRHGAWRGDRLARLPRPGARESDVVHRHGAGQRSHLDVLARPHPALRRLQQRHAALVWAHLLHSHGRRHQLRLRMDATAVGEPVDGGVSARESQPLHPEHPDAADYRHRSHQVRDRRVWVGAPGHRAGRCGVGLASATDDNTPTGERAQWRSEGHRDRRRGRRPDARRAGSAGRFYCECLIPAPG